MQGHTRAILVYLILLATASAREGPERVAVLNSVSFHNEVYPAFHFAWARAGYSVSTFATGGRDLAVTDITKNWGFEYRNISDFPSELCTFRVLIFTSVEYPADFRLASRLLGARCKYQQSFVFVLHNPRSLRDGRRGPSRLRALLQKNPHVNIITLGPHTKASVQEILGSNGIKNFVDFIIPFFPIDKRIEVNRERTGFALQGSISDRRRNYKKLIDGVVKLRASWPSDFKVTVLGRGNTSLPEDAADLIFIKSNVNYPEYYETIQDSLGLLTAFASKIYFREKASSTVAASLICGMPLLTEAETVDVYSYVSRNSVWIRERAETDATAMLRIVNMPDLKDQFQSRYNSLQEDIKRAESHNSAVVNGVMDNILPRTTLLHASSEQNHRPKSRVKQKVRDQRMSV